MPFGITIDNWNQSTKAELYKDNKAAETDVNGDDDVRTLLLRCTSRRSRLSGGEQCELIPRDMASSGNAPIDGLDGSKATSNIQYDMAVTKRTGNS